MAESDKKISTLTTSELWDEIGFHKPMAGFWFNITYTLIGIVLSAFLMGYLMSIFYPFPESVGYRDIGYTIFGLVFVIFDVGTGAVMSRFLPETNIKNPEKMLHYIQYFIWYQMMTGLIQTTGISVYALVLIPHSNLAYVTWIMLIVSTIQYPGFLWVFKNVLDALQHYNKSQTLNFVSGAVFQRITELGFLYLGKVWGQANPRIGALLGISIGSCIGIYVDDFLAMLLSAHYFSKVMKAYGITPRDCFRVEFTWKEIKPVVIFSVKTGFPGIIGSFLGLVQFYWWVSFVPQYTTIAFIAAIGGSIPDIINWFGVPSIGALVSESYMNGKKKLTQYYIGQLFRFLSLEQGFFIPLILLVISIMPIAWVVLGMINYLPGLVFMIPQLIAIIINHYLGIPGQVIYGANKPNFTMIVGLIQGFVNTIVLYIYLSILRIADMGLTIIAWVKVLGLTPVGILFGVISFYYVQRQIVQIRIPWKQMVFGIALPCFITYILLMILKAIVFNPLYDRFGFYIAILPSILLILLILLFIYFPLTAFLGGWDHTNLEEFRKVSKMSGPSKFFVSPIFKIVEYACKKSKYHNKFDLSIDGVIEEAKELLLIKRENREKLKEKMEGE